MSQCAPWAAGSAEEPVIAHFTPIPSLTLHIHRVCECTHPHTEVGSGKCVRGEKILGSLPRPLTPPPRRLPICRRRNLGALSPEPCIWELSFKCIYVKKERWALGALYPAPPVPQARLSKISQHVNKPKQSQKFLIRWGWPHTTHTRARARAHDTSHVPRATTGQVWGLGVLFEFFLQGKEELRERTSASDAICTKIYGAKRFVGSCIRTHAENTAFGRSRKWFFHPWPGSAPSRDVKGMGLGKENPHLSH